jgi:hypothetical protein
MKFELSSIYKYKNIFIKFFKGLSLADIRGKVAQAVSDLIAEREASERLKVQLSETFSSSVKSFLGSNFFKYAA